MRRARPERSLVLPPLPPLDADDEIVPDAPKPVVTAAPEREQIVASEAMLSMSRQAVRALDMRPLAMWERTAEIAAALQSADERVRQALAGSVYPFAAYDRFRRDNALRPPPGAIPDGDGLTVIVDAGVAAPFLLRETLRGLQEQTVADWRALVIAPASVRGHPVASFADIDRRFVFVDPSEYAPPEGHCLLVTAGTALDQYALAWLLFAAGRTGAKAVIADHDHGVLDPDLGSLRADPWFFSAFDSASLDWLPAPAAVWLRSAPGGAPSFDGSDGWRRDALRGVEGAIAHAPRLLATMIELPINARNARETPQDPAAGRLGPVAPLIRVPEIVQSDGRIAVIIPTRDGADLLERAVVSLRRTARAHDRLDIVVVDNRSADAESHELFRRLEAEGAARVLPFDKPFNWGLVNNEGAQSSDAPWLVFANNDIEMLSRGWDDVLIDTLSQPGVGALGARLLYPNGTVQHGGVVFGMVPGHTEHEGRGIAAGDPGPNRRLVTPRTVGAVTGAFFGMSRETWDAVGHIDVVMGVAHSDLDLCLKIREQGLTIRYEPRIEAIHFESVTRGFNSTKADVAWDESERTDLVSRWGRDSMVEDIGVSPYWARSGNPFDLIREPSMIEVVRHIDRTGRPHPWRPSRAADERDAMWAPERLA